MYRALVIISTFIMFVVISVPLVVGYKVQSQFYDVIESVNHKEGVVKNLTVEVLSYHKGYLNSHANLRFIFLINNKKVHFDIRNKIYHGPIVKYGGYWHYQLGKVVGKLDKNNKFLNLLFKDSEALRVIADLNFSRKWAFDIISSKAHYAFGKDNAIIWGGLTINGAFDPRFDNLSADFNFPQFGYKTKNSLIYLKDAAVISEMFLNSNDLLFGRFELILDKINYKYGRNTNYAIEGLNSEIDISNVADNINFIHTFQCDRMTFPFGRYGPLKYTFRLENLSEVGVKTFIEEENIYGMKNRSLKFIDNKEILKMFLPNKPELKVENTEFFIGANKIILSLNSSIGGAKVFDYNDFDEILNSLEIRVFSRVPKVLIDDFLKKKITKDIEDEKFMYNLEYEGEQMPVPDYIQNSEKEIEKRLKIKIFDLQKKKLIKNRGTTYQLELLYKNGALRVNGERMPLANFMEEFNFG